MVEKKLKILAAGDLHGNIEVAKKLSEKAKRGKADLVVLAGDINDYFGTNERILEPFERANQKVLFIPGNADSEAEHLDLRRKAKSLHNYYVTYGDVGIVGIGNPDWKMEFDDNDLKMIKKNFKKMKPAKKILVSHLHAAGTKTEFSGVLGDNIIRKAVEEFKPSLLIAAHIHEAEGIEDKIGNTRVVQVGRSGKFIEI